MSKLKKIISIIIWLVVVITLILVSVYLILMANGYRINYRTYKIAKTGMIYLRSNPNDVAVYTNNELKSQKTPYRLSNIFAGRYLVKISKDSYHTWEKNFQVEAGYTSSDENIQLFLQQPEPLEPSQDEVQNFSTLLANWPKKDLAVKGESEIWFADILITRFSKPIKAVAWYSDLQHIIFQIEREIHIIDSDGSNNIKIADLSSDEGSQLVPSSDGSALIYQDAGQIKKNRIQ